MVSAPAKIQPWGPAPNGVRHGIPLNMIFDVQKVRLEEGSIEKDINCFQLLLFLFENYSKIPTLVNVLMIAQSHSKTIAKVRTRTG